MKLPELQLRDAAFNKSRYVTLLAQLKLPPQIEKAMQRRWDDIAWDLVTAVVYFGPASER